LRPTCCAEFELSGISPSQARRIRASLRRAGYHVAPLGEQDWTFARRPLRGHRELVREARHLETVALDVDAVTRLPERAVRPTSSSPRAFPVAALEYLKGLPEWTWSWAAAERRGRLAFLPDAPAWRILAWCSLIIEPSDDPYIEVGAQVFPSDGDAQAEPKTLRRIKRALAAQLQPHGYRPIRFRAKGAVCPAAIWMYRRVDTLSVARAERRRLDRLIIGD
jgi:hypothetical protein